MMTGHWLTRTTRFLIINVMLATLVACGGGGGGGTDGGGFLGGNDDNSTFTLLIQTFDDNGASTPQFSIDQPLRVVVSLRSMGGGDVSAQRVELSTTVGTITPSNGSALTNTEGDAEFVLSYDNVAGAGTVTASYINEQGTVTSSIGVEVISPASSNSLEIMTFDAAGNPSSQFSATSPMTVDVALVNASGLVVPLNGELIQLSSSIGEVIPTNGTALLVDGIATFNVAYDGNVGAGELTATYDASGEVLQANRGIQAVIANPYTISITSSGGDLTASNSLELTVKVLDSVGQVIESGPIVDVSTTIGDLDRTSAVADAAGESLFRLTYTGPGAGVFTASVTTAEGTFTNAFNVNASNVEPYELDIVITKLDGESATSEFTSSEPAIVAVTLTEDGIPPNSVRPITLALSDIAGQILPDNAVALTDADGKALFRILYDGQTGAGQIIASYAGPLGDVSKSAPIAAEIADLDIGSFDETHQSGVIRAVPSAAVSYRGSAALLLAVVDTAGQLVSSEETVRFSSPCLLNGFSTLDTGLTTTTVDGLLSATYTAGERCQGPDDTITATLMQPGLSVEQQVAATVTLEIGAPPAANERFITFVSAEPVNIALRGTGGGSALEERSQVTFEVRDGAGNPVAGQRVEFDLSTTTGGIELADISGTTDANGQVNATVFAGVVATPVRVIARTGRRPAVDGDTDPTNDTDAVKVVSDQLSVSSGIATQARFSIAAQVLNVPGAAVVNGRTTEITASAFDRFGNPVPDGTTVNFTSECGGIGLSGPTGACEMVTGFCTVTWFSQPGAATICPDNRVSIMAHALGEEAFTDTDGNGFYTFDVSSMSKEDFTDNQEAWRDDNESVTYNAPELFIDIDTGSGSTSPLNGKHDERTPPEPSPAALFNGLACPVDQEGFEDYCKSELVSVFDSVELIANTDNAGALTAVLVDSNGEPLPADANVPAGNYVLRLSDDTVLLEGTILAAGFRVRAGTFIPSGTTLPTGTTLPAGASLPDGTLLTEDTLLTRDIVLTEGVALAEDFVLTEDIALTEGVVVRNFPPFGTTVSTSTGGECEVVSPSLSVGNSSAETFFSFPVTIRTEEIDDPTTDDFVEITWTIPGGNGNQAQLVFDCDITQPNP